MISSNKEWRDDTCFTKIYTSLFLWNEVKASVVWERRRLTAILTHNFLTTQWDAAPGGHLAIHWRSPWLTESLLVTSWDWLKSDCISHGHLNISFHNAHHFHSNLWLLPLIYTFVSCTENLWLTAWSRVNMPHWYIFVPYMIRDR